MLLPLAPEKNVWIATDVVHCQCISVTSGHPFFGLGGSTLSVIVDLVQQVLSYLILYVGKQKIYSQPVHFLNGKLKLIPRFWREVIARSAYTQALL